MARNSIYNILMYSHDTYGLGHIRRTMAIASHLLGPRINILILTGSPIAGRFSFPERKRFSFYARGSLCETINWTNKAIRRGLIDAEKGTIIQKKLTEISYKINYYIRSLNQQLPGSHS